MKINATDVAYVADLANLEVPATERTAFARELSRIVEFVDQLNTVDTEDVEPTAQVVAGTTGPGRRDRVEPRDGSGEAADQVGLFRVPRVIQDR